MPKPERESGQPKLTNSESGKETWKALKMAVSAFREQKQPKPINSERGMEIGLRARSKYLLTCRDSRRSSEEGEAVDR